jgi:hypothetical protein
LPPTPRSALHLQRRIRAGRPNAAASGSPLNACAAEATIDRLRCSAAKMCLVANPLAVSKMTIQRTAFDWADIAPRILGD